MEPIAPWHTEQGCSGGELLKTCANLADSEIEMKKMKNKTKYDAPKIKRTR